MNTYYHGIDIAYEEESDDDGAYVRAIVALDNTTTPIRGPLMRKRRDALRLALELLAAKAPEQLVDENDVHLELEW